MLVHIGYHKTATSFLQKRVFSQDGLFSLPWGAQSGQAVEYFVLTHSERFSPSEIRQNFIDQLPDDDDTVAVISHEALSGQPTKGRYYADRVAMRIHETFPEARIVIGIREQKKLLASLYYQYVKMGGTDPITKFIKTPTHRAGFRPTVRLDHFEYDLMLQLYQRHWKREDILVLPMEALESDHDRYVGQLLEFAGRPEDRIAPRDAVNIRRSGVAMRMERAFNRILPPPNPRPERYRDYPLAYRLKNRTLKVLERVVPSQTLDQIEHTKIVKHIENVVGDYFQDSNRRLAEMAGLDLKALGYF